MIELRGRTFYRGGRRLAAAVTHVLLTSDPTIKVFSGKPPRDVTATVRTSLNRKCWSPDELAILQAQFRIQTLDQVARDLPNKTRGQIRHQASALGLTEDRDVWSDQEIRSLTLLRRSGVSFSDVAAVLRRSVRACEVKAHHVGVTFPAPAQSAQAPQRAKYEQLSSVAKGRVAECLVATQLVLHGLDVFEPLFPQHVVDLIAQRGTRFFRIQVKSAVWVASTSRFRVPIVRKDPRSHARRAYNSDEVDFFIAVCLGPNAMYVVPREAVRSKSDFNLYPHRLTSGQSSAHGDGQGLERYRDAFHLIE